MRTGPHTIIDESAYHLDGDWGGGVPVVQSGPFGNALDCSGRVITIPESSVLDIPVEVTLEAWVKLNRLPLAATRFGVFDNDGQYGMFIRDDGRVQCPGAGAIVVSSRAVPPDAWTHLLCNISASTGSAQFFFNGLLDASIPAPDPIITTVTNGSGFCGNIPSGDPLDGLIDCLRIRSGARTTAELANASIECSD